MAKKSKSLFEFTCEDCGYIPQPNKEKSNKNWDVIDVICPKCGGKVKMEFVK
jgi:Zn finger protein HypA/HybF involved in hydrogenase expression